MNRETLWILIVEIEPEWTVFGYTSDIEIVFSEGAMTFSETLILRVNPVAWFWPVIGLRVGLIIVIVFVAVFRRISGGE